MAKDQNTNIESQNNEVEEPTSVKKTNSEEQDNEQNVAEKNEEIKETTPEEKIKELEDKIARTFAEMENQRRRFEKEREDAFNYGGFALAKETLNLIDNLERSKQILEKDETLKNTGALKKTLEHFNIIFCKDRYQIIMNYI